MQLKKKCLESLYSVLKENNSLKLSEARIRDEILLELVPYVDKFQADRKKIFETFCDKNEDGTVKPNEKGEFQFSNQEIIPSFTEELATLLEEEVEIKNNESLKIFIESTDYKPKVGETALIDEILK